jgi:tetratricopeptide (TPR) repeat protein
VTRDTSMQMLDKRVPEAVILRIDNGTSQEEREEFVERLEPILSHLNWRTHFFIVSEGPPGETGFARRIIETLARFLVENQFVTFYVHPIIRVGPPEPGDRDRWTEISSNMEPFQRQAYEHQSEARLLILPIMEPTSDAAGEDWMRAARFFLARSARPSLILRGSNARKRALDASGGEIRVYIDPEEQSGSVGLISQLWMNAIFENLLERVNAGVEGLGLLMPCRTHRVIDQRSGSVYSCFREWSNDRPFCTLEMLSGSGARIAGDYLPDSCAVCMSRSLCCMTDNLIANNRRSEGRAVHFQLALAFSGGGRHEEAIQHAVRARDLASIDAERAAASIIKGLCHLGLDQLDEAEQTLKDAAPLAEDPGLVAFHRGRVQFAWRDYIEALDRFQEVLDSGSKAVPEIDLFYHMAVSHLQIHEYREARSYLDRWAQTGQRRAIMLYYRGLCDIGEGRYEAALSELEACERAGPDREDMGNVLFYTGLCLKELGRYEEAIPVLGKASELDANEIGVFNLLGFCLYKTARHAQAVDCFKRAIELDPRSAIDYANLATNLRELGRIEEAIAMYRKALLLDPSIAFARDNLRELQHTPDR